MFTNLADLGAHGAQWPAGPDDGLSLDGDLLDRVVPLWLADCGTRPTVRFRSVVLSRKNAPQCTGRWQLHLFSFATEARLARQTLSFVAPHMMCEAGTRPSGEGVLLLREADGPFECRIIDRRNTGRRAAPVGTWQLPRMAARQAVLHVPRRTMDRAALAARMLALEFDDPEESADLHATLACRNADKVPTCIRPQDVVDAANRMLEPVGMELACSDHQIRDAIRAHLPDMARQVEATVERIAHHLVAELAQGGCVA